MNSWAFAHKKDLLPKMTRIRTYFQYLLYFLRLSKIDRVNIELTNICNYRCTMCLRNQMKREQVVMSDGTFNAALEKCKDAGVQFLEFSAYGESTLDPKVYERISQAVQKGFICSMTTNGSKLDVEQILATGIHQVIFSLHATAGKEYQEYTKSEFSMEMLESKIMELKLHPGIMSGELKTQILVNHYIDRKLDFCQLPKSLFLADTMSLAPIYKFDKDVRTLVCDVIFKNLVIYADGTVGLGCCWDADIEYAVGNILHDDLKSVRYSRKARRLVRSTWKSDFCRKCYDSAYLQKYRKTHVPPRPDKC